MTFPRQILPLALATLAMVSCAKHSGQGSLSFSISPREDVAIATKATTVSLSDFSSLPSVNDFTLTVSDRTGAKIHWSGKFGEYNPASVKFPFGSYKATASYGKEGEEGFDKPCFLGSTDFSIEGESAQVKIKAELINSLVRLNLSDNFKAYYPVRSFKITTGAGTQIPLDENSSKAAFVDAYKITVGASLKSQAGTSYNLSKTYESLDAATLHTLKFDVTNVGRIPSVEITFNDDCQTVKLEEDLNE